MQMEPAGGGGGELQAMLEDPALSAAFRLTLKVEAIAEAHRHEVPQLEIVGNLAAAARSQLQTIPRGTRPTTLAPITAVLKRMRETCEGMVGYTSNRHGFFRPAEYTAQILRLQDMLGALAGVLSEELAGGQAAGQVLQRQAADVIPDRTARRFWCVCFGGFVVDVAAGQFFASCERLLDGGEWLNFGAPRVNSANPGRRLLFASAPHWCPVSSPHPLTRPWATQRRCRTRWTLAGPAGSRSRPSPSSSSSRAGW